MNAIVGMIATLFIMFGTGAWALKENAAAHNSDMAATKLAIEAVQADLHTSTQRILDAICSNAHNSKRVCQ